MALEGVNYAKVNALPPVAVSEGETSGKLRYAFDSHVFAASVNAIGQTIKMGSVLPIGAKIINAMVLSESLGTTGILSFGHAADPDFFVASADAGGQAVGAKMAAEAGLMADLSAAIQPLLTFTEASDVAIGKVIKTCVIYVLE